MPDPTFYPNKRRSRFAFKDETGALLVFDEHFVQLFKGGANPMAMKKEPGEASLALQLRRRLLRLRRTRAQAQDRGALCSARSILCRRWDGR